MICECDYVPLKALHETREEEGPPEGAREIPSIMAGIFQTTESSITLWSHKQKYIYIQKKSVIKASSKGCVTCPPR